MSETGSIRVDAAGAAAVAGPMTLATVAQLYRDAEPLFRRQDAPVEVDLRAVPRVDSSGLALLLEWQSLLQQGGHTLRIRNAPEDLLRIAQLCSAQQLLQLDGRERADISGPHSQA